MRIHVAADAEELSVAAAEEFGRCATDAVELRGRCSVALAGGGTPRGLYRTLASAAFRSRIPWGHIDFFWSDERQVPPDHEDSNYRMAYETLLSSVPLRPEQIHRIRAELGGPAIAAAHYEEEILATLPHDEGPPRFDVILLGLGKDGHTASLFPGSTALFKRRRLCVDTWVDSLGAHRITMTLPLINAARSVMFLVSGAEKAPVVRQVLHPGHSAGELPAQMVQPAGELLWMLDREAARELEDL